MKNRLNQVSNGISNGIRLPFNQFLMETNQPPFNRLPMKTNLGLTKNRLDQPVSSGTRSTNQPALMKNRLTPSF